MTVAVVKFRDIVDNFGYEVLYLQDRRMIVTSKAKILLLLPYCWAMFVYAESPPHVTVSQGTARGAWLTSVGGRTFAAFNAIPYAKPPVGELRFKEPERAEPWIGVWDATNPDVGCLQYAYVTKPEDPVIVGEENCLFVNVYSPQLPTRKSPSPQLDVFVFIHGGGFMNGMAYQYRPELLMDRDIVCVTLNYRLGILGFLSTEDEVLPGNNGLKDQSLALRWIKENIDSFGGNPNSITISGISAGGASVQFHYMSPMSIGLFHKGMSLSGTTLMPWTIVEKSKQKAKIVAELVGCDTKSSQVLVDCLRKRPGVKIVQQTKQFYNWRYNPFSPFGPVVEKFGKNPFLCKHPMELLVEGNISDLPWLTSVTSEEGIDPAADFVLKDSVMQEFKENFPEYAADLLHYTFTVRKSEYNTIAQKILKYYLGDRPISNQTIPELIQMIGDRTYIVDAVRAAKLQATVNRSPVYFYVFQYRGRHSFSEVLSNTNVNLGVSHGDDTAYFMQLNSSFGFHVDVAEGDRNMVKLMLDIITNFAKYGNPSVPERNIIWPTVNPINQPFEFLRITSSHDVEVDSRADLGCRKFWDSLGINEPQITIKPPRLSYK